MSVYRLVETDSNADPKPAQATFFETLAEAESAFAASAYDHKAIFDPSGLPLKNSNE